MKKILFTCLLVSTQLSWANSGGSGSIGDIAKQYLDKIDLNPQAWELARLFKLSARGITDPNPRGPVWSPDLKLNTQYACEVFWILQDPERPIPLEHESAYNFKPFGRLILKNKAAMENIGQVETFGNDPISNGDLIGRSRDKSYFEAIRLDYDGGLLVEIQTKEYYYIKYILSMIGGDAYSEKLTLEDFKNHKPKSLALPPVIEQNLHLVLGYAYCPVSESGRSKLQMMKTMSFK